MQAVADPIKHDRPCLPATCYLQSRSWSMPHWADVMLCSHLANAKPEQCGECHADAAVAMGHVQLHLRHDPSDVWGAHC